MIILSYRDNILSEYSSHGNGFCVYEYGVISRIHITKSRISQNVRRMAWYMRDLILQGQ